MSIPTKALFAACALTIASAGVAAAQQAAGNVLALPPKERYAATDKNKDGKVNKDEFLAVIAVDARPYIDAIWDNRDSNKDGWLSETEMNANGGGRAGPGRGALPAPPGAARPVAP